MTLTNWIFGPQAIGLLFLLIGIITYFFPAKTVNTWYGFKTPSSKNNQQTWDVANRFAAIFCIKAGLTLVVGGILINLLISSMLMPVRTQQMLHIISFMGSGVFIGPLLMVATEKYIEKTFKQ
ncbi:SdpI family protein [Mucilaginibacter calamicampi]|uniref:SdpI family protein n=1 Tax=Mucilaginibacter calamicampi TaxID=1302352 RepID=A0ABW2Z3N3_9SPHI